MLRAAQRLRCVIRLRNCSFDMQVQETLVFSAGMVKREDVIGGSVGFCNSDFYYARGVWYKTVACFVHSNLRLIIEYKL